MTYDAPAVIRSESEAFLVAARAGLDVDVPTCPGWQLRDLVAHLGGVYDFHGRHLIRGTDDPPTGDRTVPEGDDADLLLWFTDRLDRLLLNLGHLPPDAPAWNFARHTPQVVAFWPRRMALETAVHRWDAQLAHHDAHGFDLAVAVDGIDEVLTVMRPARLHRTPLEVAGVVAIRLTDSEATWRLRLTPDAIAPSSDPPDAVLEGTATAVLLWLWGRVPLTSLSLDGDESLVAALPTG